MPLWAHVQIEPALPTRLSVTSSTRDPAIAEAIARSTGRTPVTSEYGEGWVQWSTDLGVPSRHGLVLRQDFRLAPLLDVLRSRGQRSLSLLIQHPRAGFAALSGAHAVSVQRGTLSATVPTAASYQPLTFELGWRPADVTRCAAILLFALLAPIAVGLMVWRRSIARDRVAEAWFPRAHAIQIISLAGWVSWMVAIEATQITDLTQFASGARGWASFMAGPLWWMGYLPASFALTSITRRVTRRLRGFDPFPRGTLGSLRVLGPLLLLVIAFGGFAAGNFRAGVFATLAAFVSAVLLPGARGPLGTTPQSLSSGALRDRLFDLAWRAGVKLRELYVVRMRRERMANAFAVNGGVVMVADELLDRMSRREVDAVLAHEISHLEHHHPIKMLLAGVVVFLVLLSVGSAFRTPYMFPAAFAAAWLAYLFVARRCEFAADAGAAALTSDAEAVISGLGQLSRLNDVPLTWGRGWGWLITHPSTEARGLAIGRRAGIAPERVVSLLASGLPSVERYGHRERPGEEQRVFSTAWKTATMGRLGLTMLAAAVAAPAAGLALGRALGLATSPLGMVLVGAALALGAMLIVHDLCAARVVSRLQAALRRRLEEPPGAALFVALSPGDRPRIYEGFLDWDIGLLTIGPDRLYYRGEQLALDLPRAAVCAIEVGAGPPSWIQAPRVILRWLGSSGEQALSLRPADSERVSAIGPASHALATRLRAWREGAAEAGVATTASSDVQSRERGPSSEAAPGIGPVTARTPAEAAGPRDLPLVVMLIGTLSAAASFALGLDFWLGLDVFAAALIGVIAMRWPMMTSRERSRAHAGTPESERRAA